MTMIMTMTMIVMATIMITITITMAMSITIIGSRLTMYAVGLHGMPGAKAREHRLSRA
jgi:hypothetical protein